MMVVEEMITACLSYGVQLVVGQLLSKVFARGATGAVELVVRVIHLVAAHYGFEAAFVKRTIVCNKWQTLDKWLNLLPDIRKHGRVFGILFGDAVDERVPIEVIIGLGLDKGIKGVHKLAFFYNHHTNAAHAGALVVGGLEVYGGERVHKVFNSDCKNDDFY